MHELTALLREYDRARAYTDELWQDLTPDEVTWRPHEHSSAIGWHLGHQAHVAHFMIRNLTAAEPSPDPELDGLMDSANPEKSRGTLPTVERLTAFRDTVGERVHARIGDIAAGKVGAPTQLTSVAHHLLVALITPLADRRR
ncbi:DinB family protein [Streptomyces sp. NPDC088812]|uniref:DinB family protein n=1 Tax=Streptomyces sp. NPDC088812 TaxID=3365905 RepID=UPI0037FB21A5